MLQRCTSCAVMHYLSSLRHLSLPLLSSLVVSDDDLLLEPWISLEHEIPRQDFCDPGAIVELFATESIRVLITP